MQVNYKEKLYFESNKFQVANEVEKYLDLKNKSCLMEKARLRNEKHKKAQASYSGNMMTNEIIKWKLKNIKLNQSHFSSAHHSFVEDKKEENKIIDTYGSCSPENKKFFKFKNYDYNPFLLDNSYNFKVKKNKLCSLTPYLKNLYEKINNKKNIRSKVNNKVSIHKDENITKSIIINYPISVRARDSEKKIFSYVEKNGMSEVRTDGIYNKNYVSKKVSNISILDINSSLTSPKNIKTNVLDLINNKSDKNIQNSKSNIFFKQEESNFLKNETNKNYENTIINFQNNNVKSSNPSYAKTERNTIQEFFDTKIKVRKVRIKSEVYNNFKHESVKNFHNKKSEESNTQTHNTPKKPERITFFENNNSKYHAFNHEIRKKIQMELPNLYSKINKSNI
jgi:hypothetical protein